MSLRTAAEHVRVAHALTRLPKITEAFAAGRISYSKVRAMTRDDASRSPGGLTPDRPGTEQEPESETRPLAGDAEQVLLDLALTGTASHVERVVRATRRARTTPSCTEALRSLKWHYDDSGSLVLRGRFTPDEGARLVNAVEALVTPRQPVPSTTGSRPAAPTPCWRSSPARRARTDP